MLRTAPASAFFAGILAFLLAAPATGAVQLLEDQRQVNSIGQNCDEFSCDPPFDDTLVPPQPFGPWSIFAQSSTVTPQLLQGSGWGSSYSDIGWFERISVYEVVFAVDAVTDAHLQGDLSTDILWGWPAAGVRLTGPWGTVYEKVINDSLFEDGSFDETAILLPGEYAIRVWADGGTPIADAWFDFSLALTPSTACGMGAELVLLLPALGWARRRRARGASASAGGEGPSGERGEERP